MRHFITIDWGYLGGIEYWLDSDLTLAAAQEFHQLIQGEWAAVLRPHHPVG